MKGPLIHTVVIGAYTAVREIRSEVGFETDISCDFPVGKAGSNKRRRNVNGEW